MSVPEGFKQTEVGVIPDDWEVSDLESISLVPMQNGLFYEPKRKGSGVHLVNVGDMYKAAPIAIDELDLFDATALEIKSFRVQEGDIFFTRSSVVPSGIAYCNILPNLNDSNVVFDSHLIRVRANPKIMDARFLYLNCLSVHSRKYLVSSAKISTMTTIDQGTLKKCPVLVPPLAEQTAIAAALSDMDSLIEGAEKLLEKKRRIKQGAMQELLRPKEGWKQIFLGSISDILTGFPFPSSGYSDDGIKLLRGSNVKRGNIDWSKKNTKYWKTITHDIKSYELQAGDIVIAMDGSLVGKSFAQVSEDDLPALLLQRVARIRTDKVDINYISHLVCGKHFTIHCEQIKTSSAIPHISPKDIRDFQIPLPPTRAEQTAIAAILSDMDTEIEQLETQLTKYRQLKTGMMQELLTGKKRLV